MKKIQIVLLIVSMVLGLTLTGCSNIREKVEGISKAKDDIKENIEEVSKIKEGIKEIINIEDIDIDKISDLEGAEGADGADAGVANDVWGEIAKYKVDNIIEEKINSEVYMLVYISKEDTASLVDYFDGLLKETEEYNCEKVTEKETVINGYLRGTINESSIIVAVAYDNVNDENRVEFTSY